jgi:hypothetical protein
MALDGLVLSLQRGVDRVCRWVRLRPAPDAGRRRFLIVQVDGLSREVLERTLEAGRLPGIGRLLAHGRLRMCPMSVGIPSSTPFFQAAMMYGVRPDIPGFHWYDKRLGQDRYFPRPGVAALVEDRHARGRRGIMEGGSAYGCVFTGGALDSLWTLSRLLRPTRAGAALLRVPLSAVLLAWVIVKCCALTVVDLGRALLGLVADPVGRGPRALRWVLIKIGLSIWTRQLLTLAASSDLYRGVPAIYVNYLEYDVFAHAFGPSHPLAIRALREVDRSVAQLARILRRVPEHAYDLYVLSDHGQAPTVPFPRVAGGISVEEVVLAALAGEGSPAVPPPDGLEAARLRTQLATYREARGHGLVQRFLSYLEGDFARWLGAERGGRPAARVRVVAAGPNAFVYFTDSPDPLDGDEIERRHPGAAAALSRHRGIGFVLARGADGPVCWCRGERVSLGPGSEGGPFAARVDREVVLEGLRELMAMPSTGDLVLYGIGAPGGDVSFLDERGAHAGPSAAEMQTFILHPPSVRLLPEPLTHPIQLYAHFGAYAGGRPA